MKNLSNSNPQINLKNFQPEILVKMASTTSDLTLLGRKLGALDYDPGVYVRDIARNSVGGHELIQHRNNIKVRL